MTLEAYGTCDNLLAGLRTHTAAHVTADGLPGAGGPYWSNGSLDLRVPAAVSPGSPKTSLGSSEAGTSTTNVQEIGVDEPDIVKTGAGRVITITDGVLRVLDAATHEVTGTLDLTMYNGWQAATLLASGDHAAVILGTAPGVGVIPAIATPYGPAPYAGRSTVLYVDLRGRPAITGSLRTTGSYLDARMVGSTIRLVASSTPTLTLPNTNGSGKQRIAAYRRC
jgi:hypothetical protein